MENAYHLFIRLRATHSNPEIQFSPELSFLGESLGMWQGGTLTYFSVNTLWTIFLGSLCHLLIVFCFLTFYVCISSGYSLAGADGK